MNYILVLKKYVVASMLVGQCTQYMCVMFAFVHIYTCLDLRELFYVLYNV